MPHSSKATVRLLIALSLCTASLMCEAQTLVEVPMSGQTLVHSKSGAIQGCGLRIFGVTAPAPGQATFKTFDITANYWRSGIALAKVVGEVVPVATPDASHAKRISLRGGWLQAEGKAAVRAAEGAFQDSIEDKGAYQFNAPPGATIDVLFAAIQAKPMRVGITWDAKDESVYFGVVEMSTSERAKLLGCVKAILK